MEGQERLDEVVVKTQFDLNAAIDSIRFYWNLARHKGEPIIVEIWGQKPQKKGATGEAKAPQGYVFQEEEQKTETQVS